MRYHPNLREFVGQGNILKQALGIITMVNWSVLLRGHYGYGKTELARILAAQGTLHNNKINKLFYYPTPDWRASGLPLESNTKYTIIIDECHLSKSYEWLYRPMEVNNYVFCSNMASELPEPFISRCFTLRLERYTREELIKVIMLHAQKYGVDLPYSVIGVIAQRCRGVPRTGISFMLKYQAMYPVHTNETIMDFFSVEGVDNKGLTKLDIRYLEALETGYKSRRTLQMILDVDSLELDRIERYLIQQNLVTIETRGRRLV